MSQIHIATEWQGHPLQLTIGWDRPLQTAFLTFHLTDEQQEQPMFAPLQEAAQTLFLHRFEGAYEIENALGELGIELPCRAIDDLARHQAGNVGNLILRYDADGERTVLYDETKQAA